RRPPARSSHRYIAARQFAFVDPDERQRGAAARHRALGGLAVHLDRAHPYLALEWEQAHGVTHGHGPRPGGPRHDRAGPGHREDAVDRQPEQVFRRPLDQVVRNQAQRRPELVQPLPGERRRGDRRLPRDPAPLQPLAHLGPYEVEPLGLHQVPFGDDGNAAAHPEQLDDGEVLLGLRHEPLVGRHHEQGDVDAGRTCQHVADEPLVSRDVYDAGLDVVAEGEWREAQVDRDPPALLLLPPVRIDAGEGLDERRLTVVDVTGGADYEAADGTGVEGVGDHARRSQKSRAERAPASPKWCRTKRATSRRWAAACGALSRGRSAAASFRTRRSRYACRGSRVSGGAGAQVGQATPPSATLKVTGSRPSGSMVVPSRTQVPRDGSNPSTPRSSQIPRTPAASIASGAAPASASSAAVKAS